MSDPQQPSGTGVVRRLKRPPSADGTPEKPKLFIATPAYGGQVTIEYMMGLRNLTESLTMSGLEYQLGMLSKESLITRARNKLVSDFRKTDCTHLLFIDADVGFTARDIKPLLAAGVDVVCGAYPMKNIGWQGVLEAAKAGAPADKLHLAGARYAVNVGAPAFNGQAVEGIEKDGVRFFEVLDAATGFLLITRTCIDKFIAHYGKSIEYVSDYEPVGEIHHRVFDAGEDPSCLRQLALGQLRREAEGLVDGEEGRLVAAAKALQDSYRREGPGRYLSEDYLFSRMWQMMGGRIWLCLGCKLSHTGVFTFHGDVENLFELTEVAAPAVAAAQ